jgi:peptidyl-prolyl cis-trans isomerase B (cyclophilin B)
MNQLAKPVAGELVAVMHTNHGDISIRLFPEQAPKTVENFTTHAKNGYYDGLIFHRVINNFMIQGGDPTGTGCGGECIWGHPFKDEFTPELHNLRGALFMANAGPGTNGSQFFIVQAKQVHPQLLAQMAGLRDYFPEEAETAYREVGGTPHLDYHHTVFGQVFDGMDVVDAIAAVKTGPSDKPVDNVIITTIDIREV